MEDDDNFGVTCAVAACPNNFTSGTGRDDLTYHRFPNNPVIRAAWVKACMRSRGWTGADTAYVCSDHFDEDDFEYEENEPLAVSLRPDAVPSSRIKLNIKAEPVDVVEEFGNLIGDDSFEMSVDDDDENPNPEQEDDAEGSIVEEPVGPPGDNQCKNCTRHFKTRARLKRHENFCLPPSKKPKAGPRAGAGTPCFYKCGAKFYHRNKMLKHMEMVHNCATEQKQRHRFSNMEEFWNWKEEEEERTYSYFSKRTGNHKNTAMYHCQRDGPSRARPVADPYSRAAKRQMTKGHIKENIICLAHIKTTLNPDGSVTAVYYPGHNHPLSAMDYLHHPLSRTTQNFIKEKLDLGYTPKQIADELLSRQKASGGDNPLSKNQFLHMVNKLDRIRGILDRERKRMREEALGSNFQRKRRSRKDIFEEQFEKSRQFQQLGQAGVRADSEDRRQEEADRDEQARDTLRFVGAVYDVGEEEEEEQNVDGDLNSGDVNRESGNEIHDEIDTAEDFVKSLGLPVAAVGKEEDVVQELVLDESGTASAADSSDYQALYRDSLLEIRKLNNSVADLRERLAKKDRQINLLINALKKTLARETPDLSSLRDTVFDGDYEIIVI